MRQKLWRSRTKIERLKLSGVQGSHFWDIDCTPTFGTMLDPSSGAYISNEMNTSMLLSGMNRSLN